MLKDDIKQYIELKHFLGFKYRVQASLLNNFAEFAERQDDRFVRTETVLLWAAQAPSAAQRRNRLLTIRRFTKAMHVEDSRHQVPPKGAFSHKSANRRMPHIYSENEISMLLQGAAKLKPEGSIRPATYKTLFGLIAATGLRISEALALQLDDITDDGIIVRSTKFRKSRLVPIHETVQYELNNYLVFRMKIGSDNTAVFVSPQGSALCHSTVNSVFLTIARSIGLRRQAGYPGPTIHDMRHTFAVRSLEQCTGNREAISRHMVALSTYLGHAHVTDTYWYLQTTPKLMNGISKITELFYKGGQ